jgi:flavin reductase (DIM6/NTAB) family NADH-FMN oxidoreductase RutF
LREVSASEAWLRKYPERTVMVVSTDNNGRSNIISLGWNMPTSGKPPMAAISVNHGSLSHKLISEGKEFVLVFPSSKMESAVIYCGTHSGREFDKFKKTGLTPVKARHVKPPLIAEAVVNMECRVVGELLTGDHTLFAGEILAAYVTEEDKKVLFNLGPDEKGNRIFGGF